MTEHRACPEFDCCECGRHVVLVCGEVTEPPLCGICQFLPGWVDEPELRAVLDREGHCAPPDLAAVPAWTGRG